MILSMILIFPSYTFIYFLAGQKSRAEILGKMDTDMTSDNLKRAIVDFRHRDKAGLVEKIDTNELMVALGEGVRENKGVAPAPV